MILTTLLSTLLSASPAAEAPLDVDEVLARCQLERPEECRGCVEEPVLIGGKQRLHVSRGDGGSGAVASWSWEHLLVDPGSCRTVRLVIEGGGGFGLDVTLRSPAASPATAVEKKALLTYERHVAFEPSEPRDQLRAAQGRPLPALAAPGETTGCAAPHPTVSAARPATWVPGAPAPQRASWAKLPDKRGEAEAVERYSVFAGGGLKAVEPTTFGDRTLTLHTRGQRLRSAALSLTRGGKEHAFTPLFEAGVVADGPAATVRGAGGGYVLFVERPWRELERSYLLALDSGEVRRVIFSPGDRFSATAVNEKGVEVAVRAGDEAACKKAGVPAKALVTWDELRTAMSKAPAGPDRTPAQSGSFRRSTQQDVLK